MNTPHPASAAYGEGGTTPVAPFPRPAGAPDGPDFWLLSAAMIRADAAVQSPTSRGFDVEVRDLTEGVEADTLIYCANQRLLRATPRPTQRETSAWMDGAVVGLMAGHTDQRRATESALAEILSPNAIAALIREIDGAHDKGAGALGEEISERLTKALRKARVV